MNDSVFSCFIDSNIWLYAFINNTKEKHKSEIAQKIFLSRNIVIITQVINEVCVNLIKKAKFTEDNIQELVQDFYSNYQVIDID